MSTPAAPPMWMLGLKGIDAGAKLALIGARSFGPFDQDARNVFVWPSRSALAARIGVSENTLKGQLKRLVKLGHMRAETRTVEGDRRRGWVLCDPQLGSRVTHGSCVTRVTEDPTMGHTEPDHGSRENQTRVTGDPLNLETFQSTSNNVAGDARASTRPAHVTRRLAQARREPEPRDPLAAKLAEVSQAAAMHFDQSTAHPSSFASTLRTFIAEHDEGTALRVLAAWEQARARGDRKPAMGRLWHAWGAGNGRWFVDDVIGANVVPLKPKRQPLQDDYDPIAELAKIDRKRGRL